MASDELLYLRLISHFEMFVGGRTIRSIEAERGRHFIISSWQFTCWVLDLGLVDEMLHTGT